MSLYAYHNMRDDSIVVYGSFDFFFFFAGFWKLLLISFGLVGKVTELSLSARPSLMTLKCSGRQFRAQWEQLKFTVWC